MGIRGLDDTRRRVFRKRECQGGHGANNDDKEGEARLRTVPNDRNNVVHVGVDITRVEAKDNAGRRHPARPSRMGEGKEGEGGRFVRTIATRAQNRGRSNNVHPTPNPFWPSPYVTVTVAVTVPSAFCTMLSVALYEGETIVFRSEKSEYFCWCAGSILVQMENV